MHKFPPPHSLISLRLCAQVDNKVELPDNAFRALEDARGRTQEDETSGAVNEVASATEAYRACICGASLEFQVDCLCYPVRSRPKPASSMKQSWPSATRSGPSSLISRRIIKRILRSC